MRLGERGESLEGVFEIAFNMERRRCSDSPEGEAELMGECTGNGVMF